MPPRVLLLLSLGAAAGVVSAFMNFNQQCPGFTCAASKTAVPKKDYVLTANGCGTAALPIQSDTDFSECCNWHDVCYSTCGMKKAACEKRFEKCMRDVCKATADSEAREKCDSTSKLFSLGAQMAGCPAYQESQREACTCVPKAKVEQANRKRLVHFLTENSATEDELKPAHIEELLTKYKGQEPKMFVRLAMKYPKAIKVDAKKASFMGDMFKPVDLDGMKKKNSFTTGLKETNDEEGRTDEPPVDEHIEL